MRFFHTISVAAVGLSPIGCGKGVADRPHVAVTGRIALNNKPLSGALVQFTPTQGAAGTTSGRTGPDGSYTLTSTRGGAGAEPGSYKVTVTRRVGPDGKELPPDTSPFTGGVRETVPSLYSNPELSQLEATVPSDKPAVSLDFNLRGTGK